jgi:hypothetical protein
MRFLRLILTLLVLGLVAAAIVIGFRIYLRSAPAAASAETSQPVKPATFKQLEYVPVAIGAPLAEFGRPVVTNLDLVDLDGDGLLDVLYCEAQKNTVRWIRQSPRGVFTEQIIGTDIPCEHGRPERQRAS